MLGMHVSLYMTPSCRRNKRIGNYSKINPLLVQTETTQKTAMHLAIERRKPERALILLAETKGEGGFIHFMFSKFLCHCA